jgi:hypothetical protein
VLAISLVSAGSLASAASNEANGLARCAQISGAQERLACFDALAGHSDQGSNHPAATPVAPVAPVASAPTAAPAIQAPVASPAPRTVAKTVAPVTAAPAAAAAAGDSDANFGLSSTQLHQAPQGPQSIQARVDHVYVQQASRSYVALDNGQTWASTDGGFQLYDGETVTIRRASLGSFMLVPTRSKGSYHVRRVQ